MLYVDGKCTGIYDQTRKLKYAHLSVQHRLNDIESWASRSHIKIMGINVVIIFSKKKRIEVPRLTLGDVYIDYE